MGSAARFYNASDAVPDASGNIYIIDTYNQTLRKGVASTGPAIQTPPANQTIPPGQNATFTVAATGNPTPTYHWQRLPAERQFDLGQPQPRWRRLFRRQRPTATP